MSDESVLDDSVRLVAADPEGMLRELASAGAQLRRTAAGAAEAGVDALADDGIPRSVLVLGTGVAALAGEALAALAGPAATAPILVHRDVELPRWVGAADMVIALSPSGAGIQALAAANTAAGRGARVVGVGADDSPLAALVAGARGPYLPIALSRWQRTTFWPLLSGLLCLTAAIGVIDVAADTLERAAVTLEEEAVRCRPDSESVLNPAKQLALQLLDSTPVAWAGSPLTAVAAHRFAESVAGMAGGAAPYYLLDGNAQAMGLIGGPLSTVRSVEDLFADRLDEPAQRRAHAVLLREPGRHPVLDRAAELAEHQQLAVTELLAGDESPVVRLAQLIEQLDLAAGYLAIAEGLDPAREFADGALA